MVIYAVCEAERGIIWYVAGSTFVLVAIVRYASEVWFSATHMTNKVIDVKQCIII